MLPFANMSRDPDDEYFSDGLAEEIINALAKVPGLKVIARTSAFAFKGQNTDIRKIAETLGVTNVLEGSVRRAGNRIRVTAQLITAGGRQPPVVGTLRPRDGRSSSPFRTKSPRRSPAALKLKFAPGPAARPRHQPNLQAYEAYLRYRHYQWAFTPEALQRSRECLEQAIKLDPEFALPVCRACGSLLRDPPRSGRGNELIPRARSLVERALELEPDLSEAHGMSGVMAGFCEGNWKQAEQSFQRAMAREPVPWHASQLVFDLLPLSVGPL